MIQHELIGALRAAISRADPSWVNQPSHLRRRLEEELGANARGHRAQIHQLVVAAEERVPIRLKRNGFSPTERDELTNLLVTSRGWTAEASVWAVTTWAVALGLTDERLLPPTPSTRSPSALAPAVPTGLPAGLPEPRNFRVGSDRPQPTEFHGDPRPTPARGPLDQGAAATNLPSEAVSARTDLPSEHLFAATDLPGVAQWPVVAPRGATEPIRFAQTKPPGALPLRGTRKCTRKAAALLGRDVDVAYQAKVGASPAWLFFALPVGLAAFVLPALSGVLLVVFMLIIAVGSAVWPSRVVAFKDNDVWLLANKRGGGVKPTAVLAQTTRDQIVFARGWPFPSVRLAGERLWFQYPFRGAARRMPAPQIERAS